LEADTTSTTVSLGQTGRRLEEVRVVVRERQAAWPLSAGRLAALHRAVLVSTVVVGALGGMAVWRTVDRLDEEWARHAVVRGEMADVEAVIRARLDETVGLTGLDSRPAADDAHTAHDSARRTVVVVLVLAAGLGCAVTWLGRIRRPQDSPASEERTRRQV
jgi:hypothetical protein